MSKFYDELVEGLNEAIAFAKGEDTGARVHVTEVPLDTTEDTVLRVPFATADEV